MISIVEFLAKKHQELKKYPLITLEDIYNEDALILLFAYLYEYATKKVLEGYILSTDKNEILDITELTSFKEENIWPDKVFDKVKKIIDIKTPYNNVDFTSSLQAGKKWILQTSFVRGNMRGHDDQKYYDIRK